MPEMHLIQPGNMYGVCGPFTKSKERIQKFKEKRRLEIYLQNWATLNLLSKWYGLWRF